GSFSFSCSWWISSSAIVDFRIIEVRMPSTDEQFMREALALAGQSAEAAGALVAARVQRLVFGARDLRFGGVRSKFQVADSAVLNHRVEVVEGVLAVECVELLRAFFE